MAAQQKLVNFLNDGKAIYLEGNDFARYHSTSTLLQKFGATYGGDGFYTNNVQTLNGVKDTLMDATSMGYLYGDAYADLYVDYINSNGADLIFRSQDGRGRGVAYSGPDGSYRTIFNSFFFGAIPNEASSCTKEDLMAAMMRYLRGDTLVLAVKDEISAAAGGQILFMLEAGPEHAGRWYGLLGSASGTDPGFPIGSVTLPLNEDDFTWFVYYNLNTPYFKNFRRLLDGQGRGRAVLDTRGPLDPALAGTTLDWAYVVFPPFNFASNPSAIEIID